MHVSYEEEDTRLASQPALSLSLSLSPLSLSLSRALPLSRSLSLARARALSRSVTHEQSDGTMARTGGGGVWKLRRTPRRLSPPSLPPILSARSSAHALNLRLVCAPYFGPCVFYAHTHVCMYI